MLMSTLVLAAAIIAARVPHFSLGHARSPRPLAPEPEPAG
jgi:hypothetical protein